MLSKGSSDCSRLDIKKYFLIIKLLGAMINAKESCCLSLGSRWGQTMPCLPEAGHVSLLFEIGVHGGVGAYGTDCLGPLFPQDVPLPPSTGSGRGSHINTPLPSCSSYITLADTLVSHPILSRLFHGGHLV